MISGGAGLATMVPGLLPDSATWEGLTFEWHWPGFTPLEEVNEATADHDRLTNGTLTFQEFWAKRGYDWRDVMEQQAEEQTEIKRLGLVFGDAPPEPQPAQGDFSLVA